MWNLQPKIMLLHIAALPLFIALAATLAVADGGDDEPADEWIHSPAPTAPISVQLKFDSEKQFVSGLFATHIYVVVRNDSTDKAVAIRNIKWWEGGRESLDWHGRTYGSTVQYEKGDVAVLLDAMTQSLTSLAFEKGLLLPGEELEVHMPFTPQRYANNTLQIEYIAVGDDENPWHEQVFIPGPVPIIPCIKYRRLSSPDDVRDRYGQE